MVTLVSRLPAGLRASAVRIGAMIYSAGREEVLTALLRDVPDAQYSRLIQFAIESLADIETRERVRMRLIPYMRVGMISEVFEHYRTISNGIYHAEGLAALAPLLPKSLVGSCLECVRVLPNNYNRGRALSALMPRLTGPLLDRGFEALTTIDDPYCLKITVENFIKTVGLLPEFERSEFCDKLVQTVVLVPDVRYSVGGEQLLTQLIKFVPDLALKALQLGTRLQDDRDYAATLLAVAQGLSGSELARDLSMPDESFGQILERATAANGSERHIVEGLSAYSPYLSEAMFDALLNALVIISKKIRHENQPFSDPRYGPAHHPTIRSKLLRRMMQFYEASEEERPLIAEISENFRTPTLCLILRSW